MTTRSSTPTAQRNFLLRLALLWLLLELLAATQVRSAAGATVAWSWARAVVEPIIWCAGRVATLGADLMTGTQDTERLIADVQRLRLELEEARARLVLLEEDRAALSDASQLVGIAGGFESTSIVGRCRYRNLSAGEMEVRTTADVLLPDDTPAVTAAGVVGRVTRGSGHRYWIELISHPAAAVAVQTVDGSVHGLVTGSGRAEVRVEYVPRDARLLRGARLVTSAADGIYPPGLPVAEVTRIRETDRPFLEIVARPAADLATVRVVLLMPSWSGSRPGARER